MYTQNTHMLGALYIAFGVLLFLSIAGFWLFKVALAFAAFHIINYGLALRGMPPLTFYLVRWFSGTRPY